MMDPDQLPEHTPLDIPEPPLSHNGASGGMGPSGAYHDASGVIEPTEPDIATVTVEPLPHRPFPRPSLPLPARTRYLALRRRLALHRRRWIRVASAALLLALVAVLALVVVNTRATVIHYTKLTRGNLTVSFGGSGLLQTATYGAGFTGSGSVSEIDVTVGQQVNQGDTIAKLNTTLLQDAYNEAQTAVSNAQTAVTDAQNTLQAVQAQTAAEASSAYDAEQAAINACNANDSACVQKAQDDYATAQAKESHDNAVAQQAADEAQNALNTAQARLQTAQDNLSGAVLTAPHAGTITAINGAVGSVVVGLSSNAPVSVFAQIADLSSLQVKSNISVNHISGVAKGDAVQIRVPVAGNQVFNGTVDAVSPVGASSGGALTYPVVIDVAPPDTSSAQLLPGMRANVVITTQQREGVLLIPVSAVTFATAAADRKHGGFLTAAQTQTALSAARNLLLNLQNTGTDLSQDDPTAAYVLQFVQNKWVAQPVVIGLSDGASYEVLATTLNQGDTIVTGQTNSAVTIPKPTPTISG
ncbi:MAG TPA: efflux RND transporter periplasmic adaptor subunit [Ktedonobacterales bacterium]|nr:efflux RND transporter periplasmic adaptor subunit [Ktedonobacterales bacterium]